MEGRISEGRKRKKMLNFLQRRRKGILGFLMLSLALSGLAKKVGEERRGCWFYQVAEWVLGELWISNSTGAEATGADGCDRRGDGQLMPSERRWES